jgi:hypothetical protein
MIRGNRRDNDMAGLIKVDSKFLGPLKVRNGELEAGKLRLVEAQVKLTAGTHYTGIQGKMLLSPEGAMRLNQIAGLSIALPVGSWSEAKDKYGFSEVSRRVLVVGHTPGGKLQVVDYSCSFSVRAYFIKALFGKVTGRDRKGDGEGAEESSGGKCGFLGTVKHEPEAKPGERWEFVPVDESGVGLWVDLAHPKIAKAYETQAQDRQFADRRCLGIALRNALAMHGAMPGKMLGTYKGYQPPPEVTVPVYQWRGDSEESAAVAASLAEGRPPAELKGVETVTVTDNEPSDDDVAGVEELDERALPEPDAEAQALTGEVRRPRGRPRKEAVPVGGSNAQAQTADAGEEPAGLRDF